MNRLSAKQQAPEVAKRLRLLQVEMRSVNEASRAAMLREQLSAIVDGIPAPGRTAFLEELAQQFPCIDAPAASLPPSPAQPGVAQPSSMPPPEDLFMSMPAAKQAKAVQALIDQGLLEMSAPQPVVAADSGPPRSPRADIAFIEFLRNVVPFFLRTAESLGLQTEGLVEADVLTRAEAGIAGTDPAMGPQETDELLDGLALAVSSLISVIPHLGKYCTQNLAQQLAAERIEDLSHNEGKAVLERWDTVYWRKYRQMSAAFADGTLEKDVNMKVAGHVDKWLQRARQNLRRKE